MIGDIKFWVIQKLSQLVHYGKVTANSPIGNDAMSGRVAGEQHFARRFWNWGFRSVPPVGAECISIGIDGSSGNRVMIAADNMSLTQSGLQYTYGPNDLNPGEIAVYDKAGSVIRLHQDGSISIVPAPGAKVKLGDSVDANLDSVALFTQLQSDFDAFVMTYNNHKHTGITVGGGVTALPDLPAGSLSGAVASSNVAAKK